MADEQQTWQPLPIQPAQRPLPFFAQGQQAQSQALKPNLPPAFPLGFQGQGWYTPARQAQMFDQLTKGGLSPTGAQAIMSHMMNVESRDAGPNAFNPAGGGHGAMGIAQWRGPRQAGLALGDAPGQTQRILDELSGGQFKKLGGILSNPNIGAPQAARAAEQYEAGMHGKINPSFLAKTQAGMPSIGRPMPPPPSMGPAMAPPPRPMAPPPSMPMGK